MVAVNQIGIGQELVNTLFVGLTSALALAAGFAFGLGGRGQQRGSFPVGTTEVTYTGPLMGFLFEARGSRCKSNESLPADTRK